MTIKFEKEWDETRENLMKSGRNLNDIYLSCDEMLWRDRFFIDWERARAALLNSGANLSRVRVTCERGARK